ncbi:MAG: hypothetical protein ACTSP4_04910 [Candidatus Hodarchaeales archaeon]
MSGFTSVFKIGVLIKQELNDLLAGTAKPAAWTRVVGMNRKNNNDMAEQLNKTVKVFSFLSNVVCKQDYDSIPSVIDILHDDDMFIALEAETVLKEIVDRIPDHEERDMVEEELFHFRKKICYMMEKMGMVEVVSLDRSDRNPRKFNNTEGSWDCF